MEKQNHTFLKGTIVGVLTTLILIAVAGLYISKTYIGDSAVISLEVMAKLEWLQYYADEHFLYDVDMDDLQDGLYEGYMAALGDPYSTYYDAEETISLLESTSGEYSGIGATMSQNTTTGIITVVLVFADSPAEEAGLMPGDILLEVNGEDITAEELTNIVAIVKGEEGTDVDLGVYRESTNEILTVTATRGIVENPTVAYQMLDNQIGYIQVSEFDTVTLDQFTTALTTLQSEDLEGLIIDLRNNSGGLMDTVVGMLEQILPEGLIVYTEDKYGNIEEKIGSGDNEFDIPLVVLTNGFSASASEIFAGAVQDYEVGVLVGTTTYGKGIVQQLISLPDNTMIKITISEYFTPLGRNIHGIGIVPDVEVEYDSSNLDVDEQLEKALEVLESYESYIGDGN